MLATQVVFPAPFGPTGRRGAGLMARQPTAAAVSLLCFARSYSKNGSQSKIVGMFETEQAEFALALHHDSSFPG